MERILSVWLYVFVAEGPLKKLYERIRSQRENWQQRSVYELHDAEAHVAVDGSHGASALHEGTTGRESSLLISCMYSADSISVVKKNLVVQLIS